MYTKTCIHCGEEFRTSTKQRRYCSDECKKEEVRKKARVAYYRKRGMTEKQIEEKESKNLIKKCSVCRTDFKVTTSQTTCSDVCQVKWVKKYQHEYYLNNTKEKRKKKREQREWEHQHQ